MRNFFKFKLNVDKETIISVALVWAIAFIISAIIYLFSPKSIISSTSVAVFYSIWVFASLFYAFKNDGLKSIGLPGKHWLLAVLAGVVLGILSVTGNNNTPDFKNAALVSLPFLSFLTLVITGVTAAFCEVIMLMGFYFFKLEKALGPVVSVLITALTWTAYHLLLLSSPGSIPSLSAGPINFIAGIFIGSLMITFVTYATKSILAAFLMNAISNIFINWFRMSVKPEDVLIADNSFPISGLILIVVYTAGFWYVHKKSKNSGLQNTAA